MPGAHLDDKPVSAEESACREESQLELHLQRQLEEDVARIFDESIYSDLEVVCGKLKILTHSCILKARTDKFYHKLHTILHVNIERKSFDEIYSFISDVYTECNIQHEEKEIISYLECNLNDVIESTSNKPNKTKEEVEDPEVFLTPKCVTPYVEHDVQNIINSSPSTDLTKEYYALVPIERNLLDKELIEQDELSYAFHSIIKGQTEDTRLVKTDKRNKPTSLFLNSSHKSNTVKHSSSCNILNKICRKEFSPKHDEHIRNIVADQDFKTNLTSSSDTERNIDKNIISSNIPSVYADKSLDPPYSPDSLITDEPSSSSDYLSAAYTSCSPGVSSSGCTLQVNVGNSLSRMENIYTLSDSGLEDTAMLGSVSSHKDVTLTNVSLSENTPHDLIVDDASISTISLSNPLIENSSVRPKQSSTSSEKDYYGQYSVPDLCGKSLKEEKQRQNEEIVILESSSLSSETGSWESVYPPKLVEKDICEKFLVKERQNCLDHEFKNKSFKQPMSPSLIPRSPFKSTSCFIDASSLVDDEEETIKNESINNAPPTNIKLEILPAPSEPVPCSTVKVDISPLDWSESNDNEDSLEQGEKKDPDSIQKDLSPTIFDMTPITEDSLSTNAFENAVQSELDTEAQENTNYISDKDKSLQATSVFMSNTPNNSIISVKTHKQYESEESVTNNIIVNSECFAKNQRKSSNSPPILSGGVSVEDYLPRVGSSHESSPLPKFKLENTPIVTGAYLPQSTDHIQAKSRTSSASAWVVDMSSGPKTDDSINLNSRSSEDSVNEKKNLFSMYIDLGDKSTLKDMPARLSSSMNTKKNSVSVENKSAPRNPKAERTLLSERNIKENDASVSIFEKYESLCNNPNISISEIIAIPEKPVPISTILEDPPKGEIKSKVNVSLSRVSGEKITSKKGLLEQKDSLQKETSDKSKDLFVKLSDLDKPVLKSDVIVSAESNELSERMTRSIPDWGGQTFSINSRSIEVITSFHSENALSLNRLFPHLKNEFSRSMPGSLSSRTRSPLRLGPYSTMGDGDDQNSDMSEISSIQSSNCRSGYGNSTTDSQTSSLIENCTSRLGQDLLRMFLEEIAPDVIVEVSGKRFKAHKCILSSRCQFFAAILSGGWVESTGNVISLPPFSYNVVYFALCHIYSGLATIPDSVSIVELATIADMLGLEGLKEAIMFTLKAKYCHHFHKPCAVCIVGVLECFPLSSVYGLDDLYHKCLKWITKHFSKVWPTKAFATLPTDLVEKCYHHQIVHLTVDNVIDTVYGCGITASSLQNSRWSEIVAKLCRKLLSAAATFAASRLVTIFQAITSLPNEGPHVAKQALDNFLVEAIDKARPEEVCRAYAFLSSLVKEIRNHQYSKPDLISNGREKIYSHNSILYSHAASWRLQCEGALVRASPQVVTTQAFKDLSSELRKRLRELGCIKYGTHALPMTPPASYQDKKSKIYAHTKNNKASNTSRNVDIAQVRASFVPYAPKPMVPLGSIDTQNSNNDLRYYKKPVIVNHPPKIRTTKAQEERAKFNKTKTTVSQERLNSKSNQNATRAPPFGNTKPRYLEPKGKPKRTSVVNRHLANVDSSSESSRNSSPIHLRTLRSQGQRGRGETVQQTMSQDSLANSSRPRTAEPSTDSLSESQTSNKYATYTKAKHSKGSLESIKTLKSQEPIQSALSVNNKLRTKIPVYLNQNSKPKGTEMRNSRDKQKWSPVIPKPSAVNNRPSERKVPGSLMNATKSSSAKMVPKVVKEVQNNKINITKSPRSHTSRHQHHHDDKENPPLKEIPAMERSGTFLKDEPTFGDKTTRIDIDE